MGKRKQTAELSPAVRETAPAAPASWPTLQLPSWSQHAAGSESWALEVPAYSRGVQLISGTVAQLPLRQWRGDTQAGDPSPLLRQPEPELAAWVSYQRLVADLVHHARGYWLVISTLPDGRPEWVRRLPAAEVTETDRRTVRHLDAEYPISYPSDFLPGGGSDSLGKVLAFHGLAAGALTRGRVVLEQAHALEQQVTNYAATPLPQAVLMNDGADLPPAQVRELLAEWDTARRNGGTGYLNAALRLQLLGWSAADLTLNESRQESAIQIARLLNLDPSWLGANVSGSSLTYSNRIDLRRDLIDLCLSDYILPIEQRLSMRDVTPTSGSNLVQFDTSEFLRGSLPERAELAIQLLEAQVITAEEARGLLTFGPNRTGELA